MIGTAEARYYLQDHRIPQLFEGLMTGLIYNRPEDPLEYLEDAIVKVRTNPELAITWDMFIATETARVGRNYPAAHQRKTIPTHEQQTTPAQVVTNALDSLDAENNPDESEISREPSRTNTVEHRSPEPRLPSSESQEEMVVQRIPSVTRAAEVAKIPDVPIILFMGGPGGGKTRHAARVANAMLEHGLVHICMPDIIRVALSKYKDKYPEWKEANEHYSRGELIPNQLALTLLKAEMGRHPDAHGFFLEGYPREARQVEDFERQVKSVNMALILDYDERTLREHMERRGLGMEIIDQKIKEFKQKTLPSAKYFDDQKLLHLIPGEKDDNTIYEKMKGLVLKALETGVPVINSSPSTSQSQHAKTVDSKPENVQSPTPISADIKNDVLNTKIANHEDIEQTKSKSILKEVRQKTPHTTGSSTTTGNDNRTETPAIQTPDESRANTSHSKTIANSGKSAASSVTEASTSNPTIVPMLSLPKDDAKSDDSTQMTNSELPELIGLPNNAPVLLILGAPGSQKNDIGRRIAQKYDGFTLLSMGEILRKKINSEKNDELWEKVAVKMNNGEPIPMKLCRTLLFEELQSRGSSNWGYIIEGYPKSPDQLVDLEQSIQRLDLAILVDCTEQFCLSVIEKRNQENPTQADSAEALRTRMDFFKKNTLPMLKALDERGKLRVVDGDSDADTVFKEVVQVIDSTLFIEDDGDGTSLGESKKGALVSSTNSSTV